MVKVSFKLQLFILSLVILIGIGLMGYAVYQSNQKLLSTAVLVNQTKQVIHQTDRVLSFNKDAQNAAEAYLLSGDSSFLQTLGNAVSAIPQNIALLKQLTPDNADNLAAIDSLQFYINKCLSVSANAIDMRGKEGLAAASNLVSGKQTQYYYNQVSSIASNIQQRESVLLEQNQQANEHSVATFRALWMAVLFLLLGLTVLLAIVAGNYVRQQQKHNNEINRWNSQLEKKNAEMSDFKAMFESAPGLYLILLPDLTIDAVSEEYLQATMTERDKITGLHLFEVFPDNPDDPAADGVSNLRASLNNVIKTRAAHTMAIQKYDIRRPDGTFEERYWSPFNKPVLNEQGQLVYIIHSVVDVTQTIKSHKELTAANEEVKELYNQAPCGYLSVNADICISNINQTLLQWLGYSTDEVVGKMKYEDLLSEQSREKHLNTFERVFAQYIANGYVNNLEYEFQRKDGSVFPAMVNSMAVFDEKGNFIKSRSTVFDNTEPKKAEERLRAVNKELESFSYSVSHDLRAPLRAVHGYAQMLAEDYAASFDDEGRRLMNNIMSNAQRMGKLIDDLLDFSRLSRRELVKMPVSTQHMVTNVCNDIKNEPRPGELEFKINILPGMEADSVAIKQVWVNLISNAVKYSKLKPKSVVEIGSEENGEEVVYYVKDNGVGFDMRYVDKLFGVFQRLHSEKEFEGTGVGLAIVHKIVTRHGGRVWAEGVKTQGATFYFSLPKKMAS